MKFENWQNKYEKLQAQYDDVNFQMGQMHELVEKYALKCFKATQGYSRSLEVIFLEKRPNNIILFLAIADGKTIFFTVDFSGIIL